DAPSVGLRAQEGLAELRARARRAPSERRSPDTKRSWPLRGGARAAAAESAGRGGGPAQRSAPARQLDRACLRLPSAHGVVDGEVEATRPRGIPYSPQAGRARPFSGGVHTARAAGGLGHLVATRGLTVALRGRADGRPGKAGDAG